ncbi:MAG: hypothetical protein KDD50_03225 [Bdellovibrionales bacterium]|nr:hypothetical protein [Bdellovibrionales bacterium]
MFKVFFTLSTLCALTITSQLGCTAKTDVVGGGNNGGGNTSYTWSNIGPKGGYISSIAFHPSQSGVVWASGDDASGLYKSTDYGATWSISNNVPVNQATFSLKFNPANEQIIYSPAHYGRGLITSTDGGSQWSLSQAGLPSTGTTKHLYDFTINPTSSTTLIAATEDGLYRSTNGGTSFSKLTVSWGTAFRAATYRSDGRLYAGASDGTLKYSDDNGDNWSDIFAGGSVPVVQLKFTTHALYIGYGNGQLLYLAMPSHSGGGTINDASTDIATGLTYALTVISGASQATDTIYMGTSYKSGVATTRWGLFKKQFQEASFTQLGGSIAGKSIFSLDVDPNNSNNLVAGTAGDGVYYSRDAGSSWTQANNSVYANSTLAFAINPSNESHMLMSSSIGSGLGTNYVTTNGGSTWTSFNSINANDGESTFDIDPSDSNTILAGTFSNGAYKSTSGVSGSWSQVINKSVYIDRFIRDKQDSTHIYALATGPNPGSNADAVLYYSSDNGSSFTARTSLFANDIAPHPQNSGEAVVASSGDAYVTTNFFSSKTGLGLSSYSSSEGGFFSAAAFDSSSPSTLLVGGAKGGLYKTINYNSSGSGVTWTKLTTPIVDAVIRKIVITQQNGTTYYYVATYGADVNFSTTTTASLYRSSDGGSSWTQLSTGLYPCTIFWNFYPAPTTSGTFFGAMWGGGLMKLADQ